MGENSRDDAFGWATWKPERVTFARQARFWSVWLFAAGGTPLPGGRRKPGR